MDVMTKSQRHLNMQHIRGKDSKPEIILRQALWKKGIRYRKNYKRLPGCPDIVLTRYKIAIFVDGDFGTREDIRIIQAVKLTVIRLFGRKN